jgi:hypothetical protein
MLFDWNINALWHYIPPNLLGYSKLRTLLVHLGSWPVGKHEQSRDHTNMDDEAPCSNGIGSRDMLFDWNINALWHYIPPNLLGYSKLRTLLVHLGSWPVGKHEQSRDHTNMDDEAPYSNGMACRDMPFEWNNDTFRKS